MLAGDSEALRKARGAFFTPVPVASYITDWAVRSKDDHVLEPSCGEAVFLHEAGQRGEHRGRLFGVELHSDSAAEAERTLRAEGIPAIIQAGDFFDVEPTGDFDAVIGNPPYVRYQAFSGEARLRSRAAALRAGVSLTGLASSWAAFTVHAAMFLRPGGRLGLVLPAELMTVNYAADVRRFLMDHFGSVRLVLFTDRVFPGVLEDVVLLLAEGFDPSGRRGTDHCEFFQVQDAAALSQMAIAKTWSPRTRESKWTPSLLSAESLAAYAEITGGPGFSMLEDWGDTTLGMVTGNNKFFAMSPERVREQRLKPSDVIPLSPPGSRHLRGLTFTQRALEEMGPSGSSTWLFRPAGEPSPAASSYIKAGEAAGVHLAYKCRVRKPWWRVPYQRPADLLLTYMNADTPRLCTNRAGVHHLNSVHGLYLRDEVRRIGMDYLALASLNSVTLLGAETVGRAYGGGMLKIEPREADHLPVPSLELIAAHAKELADIRPQMSTKLRQGRLLQAAHLVDDLLLVGGLGMSRAEVKSVREDHAFMTARRVSRGREVAPRG